MTTSTRTSTRTRRPLHRPLRTKRPWATPFPHGDGASAVSSVAPSAAGSLSGSRPSTLDLCIECYAPSRMALSLRAELYHTLEDLEELSAHLLDAGADGAWKYLPSFAAITPDAVSSGANVVSTAVGPQCGDGHGAPERHQFRGLLGGLYGVGAARKKKCCEHRSFCRALRRHPRSSHHHDLNGIQLLFLLQNARCRGRGGGGGGRAGRCGGDSRASRRGAKCFGTVRGLRGGVVTGGG